MEKGKQEMENKKVETQEYKKKKEKDSAIRESGSRSDTPTNRFESGRTNEQVNDYNKK